MFDEQKVEALTEAIVNALRPVGVSVPEEGVNFALQGKQLSVMIVGFVRDSAGQLQSEQSAEDKEKLNQMLAEQAEESLRKQIEEIKSIAADPEALEAALFSEEPSCAHENAHEGLCLDCGEEIDE